MKILIDNGHGIDTKGKRSPDGRLLEYAQNRLLAGCIVYGLTARGWCAYTTRGNTRADVLVGQMFCRILPVSFLRAKTIVNCPTL